MTCSRGGGAASGVKPWSAGLQSLTPAATAPPVSRPHDLGVQGCFSRVGARRVHRHRLRGNAAQDSSRTGRGLELPTPTDARGSRQEPPAARRGPTSCAQVASGPPGPMPLRLGISAEGSAPHAHTPVIRTHVCAHTTRLMRNQSRSLSPGGGITPRPGPWGLCPSATCLWPPLREDPQDRGHPAHPGLSVSSACCPPEPRPSSYSCSAFLGLQGVQKLPERRPQGWGEMDSPLPRGVLQLGAVPLPTSRGALLPALPGVTILQASRPTCFQMSLLT